MDSMYLNKAERQYSEIFEMFERAKELSKDEVALTGRIRYANYITEMHAPMRRANSMLRQLIWIIRGTETTFRYTSYGTNYKRRLVGEPRHMYDFGELYYGPFYQLTMEVDQVLFDPNGVNHIGPTMRYLSKSSETKVCKLIDKYVELVSSIKEWGLLVEVTHESAWINRSVPRVVADERVEVYFALETYIELKDAYERRVGSMCGFCNLREMSIRTVVGKFVSNRVRARTNSDVIEACATLASNPLRRAMEFVCV
jgi:hypothetical protein